MNIMLTCAGRRNYLVKFFQEALGNRGQVFAGDASAEAAALQDADKGFVLPPVTDINYFDMLLDICQQHQVGLLIPLNDLELPFLARQRDRFLKIGTFPVVSSPEVIDICFDKWKTCKFLEKIGISTPKTYLSLTEARQAIEQGEITFPLVVKPRWGSASIGIVYPEDEQELELAYWFSQKLFIRKLSAQISSYETEKSILIQERLVGQEYGLDVINNLDNCYTNTFVKRKLAMRAGETERAITLKDNQLKNLGEKIARELSHVGNLDCDVIISSKGYYVLEMNPRFGGGYPFSHVAGANIPAAFIAWAKGEKVDESWLKIEENIMSAKCDRLVNIN